MTLTKQPAFQSLATRRGQWEEIRVTSLIAAAQDAVDKAAFYPVRSFRCAGCAYGLQCQAWAYELVEAEEARV